jgi:hypothetical protein
VAGQIEMSFEMPEASTAQTRADQVRYVEQSLDIIETFWRETFDGPSPRDQLRAGIARHYAMRPPRCVSRKSAALHESGHVVAMCAEGFGARSAKIERSPFDRLSWIGVARQSSAPCPDNPSDLRRQARVTLAGPVAAELFDKSAKGSAADNIEEILSAYFVLIRAELLEHDKNHSAYEMRLLWLAALSGAAGLVEFYGDEIRGVAAALARRESIHVWDHPIRRILKRVAARPFEKGKPPSHCTEILIDICAALNEVCK